MLATLRQLVPANYSSAYWWTSTIPKKQVGALNIRPIARTFSFSLLGDVQRKQI
jgi:hypothetical protein